MIRAGRFHVLQFLGPASNTFPQMFSAIVQRIVAKGLLIAVPVPDKPPTLHLASAVRSGIFSLRFADNTSAIASIRKPFGVFGE